MLFPELKNKSFVVLNLDAEARKWCTENDIVVTAKNNPLNDPTICQKMVDAVHQKSSKDFSYGGWMEDRSFLWKGSYLENEQKFIHLGVDFNVPVGTKVAADFGAEVVRIDSDYPEQGGWGTRIIVRHDSLPICMIYAHLDPSVMCKVGDILKPGDIFAKVGVAPYNGNWFAHCHLQTISADHFDELAKNNAWSTLDGYGFAKDMNSNMQKFKDPMDFVSLK